MTDEPTEPAAPAADAVPADGVDRRRFLNRLSGEAVSTAGKLAGFSAVVRRSVFAAGEAAAHELAPPEEEAAVPTPAPALIPTPASAKPKASAAPIPPPPALTAEQHDFLRSLGSATFAVNDPAGSPQVTAGWFDWDGEVFRLPAGLFTAKANNVARDARVSLLIADTEANRWVAVTGLAETISGPAATDAALPLLEKYRPGDDPGTAWRDLYPATDGAVIVVRPTRFVWRTD